jgi:energy-coupling factor transporter ATP-binding protein EcfA2
VSKKLVYLFGPDGAGKSTLAGHLSGALQTDTIIHGSDPASWPDTSWQQEILACGLDPSTKDPEFHLTTLTRCYAMIGNLLRADWTEPLIVDSDPRAQIAVKACALYDHPVPLPEFYTHLDGLASRQIDDDTVGQVGIHVTIGRGNVESRATTLVQRIDARRDMSSFDPASVEQARELVLAFDSLESVLRERDTSVIRVEADRELDIRMLAAQVVAY